MSITEERPAVLAGDRERTILAMAMARTWRDEEYRARLMANPRAALAAEGLEFPGHTEVRAVTGPASTVHGTSDVVHVVVPGAPTWLAPEVSDEPACAAQVLRAAGGDQPAELVTTATLVTNLTTAVMVADAMVATVY